MKVLKEFRDKITGQIHLPGESFECNNKPRVRDLVARGLIEGSKNDKPPSGDVIEGSGANAGTAGTGESGAADQNAGG